MTSCLLWALVVAVIIRALVVGLVIIVAAVAVLQVTIDNRWPRRHISMIGACSDRVPADTSRCMCRMIISCAIGDLEGGVGTIVQKSYWFLALRGIVMMDVDSVGNVVDGGYLDIQEFDSEVVPLVEPWGRAI